MSIFYTVKNWINITLAAQILIRRLKDHNRGKTNYSRQGFPWILKYSEEYSTREEAFRREMEIKNKKSRKYIEYIISIQSA